VSQSGAAQSFGGGSSTGFNDLASAGGLGPGSAAVKSNGLNDAVVNGPQTTDIVTSNQAATATFNGDASGTNGKVMNQPYTGGTATGSAGNGSGTSAVGGSLSTLTAFGGVPGDADFKSTGSGSSFVDGSALGGASGKAIGKAYGVGIGAPLPLTNGDLAFSGSSGFSPSFQDGTTGGSGSGSGRLNAAGSGIAKSGPSGVTGVAYGVGTSASNAGGGSGSASNMFGKAGGLGSGAAPLVEAEVHLRMLHMTCRVPPQPLAISILREGLALVALAHPTSVLIIP
jgi:hypothetical protein